jgi:hypothetical protein
LKIKRSSLSQEEKAAYLGPFAKLSKRHPIHNLFRSIAQSEDYLTEVKQGLGDPRDLSVLLIFGDIDLPYIQG